MYLPLGVSGNVNALVVSATVGAASLAAGLYMLRGEPANALKPIVDINSQTKILPDGSRVASSLPGGELMKRHTEVRTLYDVPLHGLKISGDGPMLGHREKQPDGSEPYVWISYSEMISKSENIAVGFRAIGVPVGQSSFIGIFSKNRPEWKMVEQAAYCYNNVIIPLYTTLGAHACEFIIKQSEMSIVVCDAEASAKVILHNKPEYSSLKQIVVMEPFSEKFKEEAASLGITVYSLAEIEEMGRSATDRPEFELPTEDDISTISYTSGTTGDPKGVMISHGNMIACVTALQFFQNCPLLTSDVMMSFLPLAHMLQRTVETVGEMSGMRIGYFRGNIATLTDDIKELRPTLIPVVPRILNRIYDKVMSELEGSLFKKLIFKAALELKSIDVNRRIIRKDTLIDRLFFRKIQDSLGGRLRLIITGSAPLAGDVMKFIRATMGCLVIEGYGQTECVSASVLTIEADTSLGTVGIPTYCNAIKLVDVPELQYFAKDNCGEVCVKGYNVFKGYYKNEAMTREVLDEDGFLHTGDIGQWTAQGTLKIIDRKKHIFKLSQGEYIAPEKIENVYIRSKLISQIFVYGESLKSSLVGIVVPNFEMLQTSAAERKLSSSEEICRSGDMKKMILDDLLAVGKTGGLYSFEQVRDIFLTSEAFTVENDLLTPTLKTKRPQMKSHFANEIAKMYTKLA